MGPITRSPLVGTIPVWKSIAVCIFEKDYNGLTRTLRWGQKKGSLRRNKKKYIPLGLGISILSANNVVLELARRNLLRKHNVQVLKRPALGLGETEV